MTNDTTKNTRATDNIYLHSTGIDKVISGIEKTVSVIRPTYGAAGGNIFIEESLYPFHSVRNDGKAIVDSIHLEDPLENMGANIIKEAGNNADAQSGDGRKTTMILTEAIFKESRNIQCSPMDIKRSIDECLPIITKTIDENKKDIEIADVKSVATISSESEEIGNILQEVYEKIGREGIVEIDQSNLPETYYEITEGVRLRGARPLGSYAYTETGKAVYKKPKILITKDKISTTNDIDGILQSLLRQGEGELVIFCDDIDMSVASMLALTHNVGKFKTLIIKAPTIWKDWIFEDFSKVTGATIIEQKNGKTLKSVQLTDLGTCDTIISTLEETRVIGIKDISEHIKDIEQKSLTDDQQKLRIAWLNTKAAVLKVGANSESELSYKIKKAKDACHASYLALKDGVVAGGGIALLNVSKSLPNTVGGNILKAALQAPFNQIIDNAGTFGITKGEIKARPKNYLTMSEDLWDKVKTDNIGFDVKNKKTIDMFEAGIIDPAIVIKNAVKNAISIAGTVITAKGVITLPKKEVQNNRPIM